MHGFRFSSQDASLGAGAFLSALATLRSEYEQLVAENQTLRENEPRASRFSDLQEVDVDLDHLEEEVPAEELANRLVFDPFRLFRGLGS